MACGGPLRFLLAASLLAFICGGCATKFDANAARDIHRVAILPSANPDGFSWPYDLKMFQGGVAPGGMLNPVSAFATGLSKGLDGNIKQNALVSAADILKVTQVRLGDDATQFMTEALQQSGYEVGSDNPDAKLTIALEQVGYVCDGLLMDGACKPRINARFRLEEVRSGKRLFATICNYGIQSSILECSLDAPPGLTFAKITDILSQPDKAGANLREAVRELTRHVAVQLARPK